MGRSSRRAFLSTSTVLVTAASAGCQTGPDDDSGERISSTSAHDPTTTGATTQTTSDGDEDHDQAWPVDRGTPGNTGATSSEGPPARATRVATLELTGGEGRSIREPLLANGDVYTVAKNANPYETDPPTYALHVYRWSTSDASLAWHVTPVEYDGDQSKFFVDDPVAALGDGVLYVAFGAGNVDDGEESVTQLLAIDTIDGSVRWHEAYETNIRILQPVPFQGGIYLSMNGHVRALSSANGSIEWESSDWWPAQFGHLAVDEEVVVGHLSTETGSDRERKLVAFDRETGKVRWSWTIPQRTFPNPVVSDGTIFVTEGDSRGQFGEGKVKDLPVRHVYALDATDGSIEWKHSYITEAMRDRTTIGGTSYVAVTDTHVYYALGFLKASQIVGPQGDQDAIETVRQWHYEGPNVFALDRRTGDVAWEAQVGKLAQVFHPPVVSDDRLYLVRNAPGSSESGMRMYVLNASSGAVEGSFGPLTDDGGAGGPLPGVAVGDGSLYVHHRDRVDVWSS